MCIVVELFVCGGQARLYCERAVVDSPVLDEYDVIVCDGDASAKSASTPPFVFFQLDQHWQRSWNGGLGHDHGSDEWHIGWRDTNVDNIGESSGECDESTDKQFVEQQFVATGYCCSVTVGKLVAISGFGG